jgi:hypothetical protein
MTGILKQLRLLQAALKKAEEVLSDHTEEGEGIELLWESLANLHTVFASGDASGTAGRFAASQAAVFFPETAHQLCWGFLVFCRVCRKGTYFK